MRNEVSVMDVQTVVTELMKGNDDLLTQMVLAVLKTRLRLTVDIDRRPYDDRSSAYQCKVDLVLLNKPSEFDDVDVTADDMVICSATSDFSIPSV